MKEWIYLARALLANPDIRFRLFVIGCLIFGFVFGYTSGYTLGLHEDMTIQVGHIYTVLSDKCPALLKQPEVNAYNLDLNRLMNDTNKTGDENA